MSVLRMSAAAMLVTITACSHAVAPPSVDELFAIDRAFSARSAEIGAGPAFVEFASDDVRAFPAGGVTLKGIDALADWTGGWSRERSITWEPEEAFISASEGFGYTWGYATFAGQDENGEPTENYGKYVTIWQRQPNGEWKWIADLGNSAPPPAER